MYPRAFQHICGPETASSLEVGNSRFKKQYVRSMDFWIGKGKGLGRGEAFIVLNAVLL
jgi:hypothetical protein